VDGTPAPPPIIIDPADGYPYPPLPPNIHMPIVAGYPYPAYPEAPK
jgi:hypothetical protein